MLKRKRNIKGLAICFVIDMFWAGNRIFENDIKKLNQKFQMEPNAQGDPPKMRKPQGFE